MKHSARGFTLVEVTIVMAVVAILTTIAIPSYLSYTRKAKRTVAQRVVLDIANRQERYYLDNRSYTLDLKLMGYTESPIYLDGDGRQVSATDGKRLYKIEVTAPAGGIATGYTLTATAQLSQAKDTTCTPLTLSQASVKGPSACW